MRISYEALEKALDENKILLYEDSLIENLRDVYYMGVPVSISILSYPMCVKQCYAMSVNLTRGMDYFKLVHGDVNFLEKNGNYPNHSWVEKDGFVYDTTDGFKWDKELYYELFQPKVHEIYDDNTIKDYNFYHYIIARSNADMSLVDKSLMIQYIESLEKDEPLINADRLFEEVELWMKNNNITKRLSDEQMRRYKQIVKQLMEESGKFS